MVRAIRRSHEEPDQNERKRRGWSKRTEAERVYEDQPSESIAVIAREPSRDCATEQVPYQRRRRRTGLFDQFAKPRFHGVSVHRVGRDRRGPVTGQIGNDHAMGRHQVRDGPHPPEGRFAGTMQEDDRRTVAALQNGCRNPS
ncbi:hypothetical protein NGM29_07685 [Natronosalvus rutilus]|uniref:Uncharacterized protein n=1 Tax=Natronosalvus rutilus TaxID=2953753 RepID=A0A9E7SXJ2_9EURY|nr:hypothetical protein [Natronosalvus rutilus]UTF55121.1 hypothetical protein NGM29_07685 [Natronosalvus rutilus]